MLHDLVTRVCACGKCGLTFRVLAKSKHFWASVTHRPDWAKGAFLPSKSFNGVSRKRAYRARVTKQEELERLEDQLS